MPKVLIGITGQSFAVGVDTALGILVQQVRDGSTRKGLLDFWGRATMNLHGRGG